MTLSWPESHLGWVLQQQQYEYLTDVNLDATNWTAVANSQFTNQVTVTITTTRLASTGWRILRIEGRDEQKHLEKRRRPNTDPGSCLATIRLSSAT